MMNEERYRRKLEKQVNRANRGQVINGDIIKVAVFFGIVFLGLILFFSFFLTFKAGSVINNTYNRRTASLKRTITRGSILATDGTVLAYTDVDEEGNEKRVYPYGELFAHVVGFEGHGSLGLESSYNYSLLSSNVNIVDKLSSEFTGTKSPGNSIVTCLDMGLQQRLNEILGGNRGAIIVMEPSTGRVLGMVSEPGFDPNTIDDVWDDITSDESNSMLLNRATQGRLTPGSTFKMFTLLEYSREKGFAVSDYEYDCDGSITVGEYTLSCVNHTAHGDQDLKASFYNSCNCSFANIGLQLDLAKFKENNEAMLFNTELPIDINSNPSSFVLDENSSEFMVMQTSFGQGQTTVSPLHLVLISCAVANDGIVMKPHIVDKVVNYKGTTVSTVKNERFQRIMTSNEAEFMKEYMRSVITNGTAMVMSYDGMYYAYGKTGTAQTSSNASTNYDHSWFTGFAEWEGEQLAVCAVFENSQEAGNTGVWAAKQVFDYWFN